MSSLRHTLEMIRFSHTLFALPFALLATIMALAVPVIFPEGVAANLHGEIPAIGFHWWHLLGILLCMVFARSTAMAFNRLVDRRIDAENPRTKSRHLPAGVLSVKSVTLFAVGSGLLFWASTLLFLPNPLPVILALPVLLFLMLYSYTKRFTSLAHFWLGISLALAPICAWIALRGEVLLVWPLDLLPAVILGAGVFLWVAGFDIIYACQDADFDRAAKLHSVPAKLGVPGALRLAALCHAGMIAALVAMPLVCPQLNLGWIYWVGIAAVAVLLVYEHLLVKPNDLARVNVAFFQVNVAVSLWLLVVTSIDLWV